MREQKRHRRQGRVKRIFFILSCAYLAFLVFAAVAASLISPYSPTEQNLSARLLPPLSGSWILGTDELGRDVFSRLVYGTRPLLLVGCVSTAAALFAGIVLGITAGFRGKLLDGLLMLLLDSILSFPTVLLAITVVAVFGYGLPQVMAAIGIVSTPPFARIARAATKSLLTEGFVESARALGTRRLKIVTRHILPNMLPDIIVQATVLFASAVLIEAALSFLGLGMQPPEPGWGLMLKDARGYLFHAPHLAFFPGLALAATVFSLNFAGDILAEKTDPKS